MTVPYTEWRRLRACEGKQIYGTKELAERVIEAIGWDDPTPRNAYQCPYCDWWHTSTRIEPL